MIAKATTIEPGIYRNVPDADYRAMNAVSKSDLDKWATGRDIDGRAALIGTVFHAAVLEPIIALEKIVAPTVVDKETGEVKAVRRGSDAWKKAVDDNPGSWVLALHEYQMITGMINSIEQHPKLGRLRQLARQNPDRCEVVVVWQDEESGLLCKAKLDQHTDKWLYDWKTSGSEPDAFACSIGAFNYHVQAAHYLSGAKACGIDAEGFRFAVACKRADKAHVCWMQDVTEPWLAAGERTRRMLLNLYARYGANDENQ